MELKHHVMLNKERSWVPVYIKSEADAVIADSEESHKKEVKQLLIELVKLKKRIAELEKENESLKYSVAALETDLAMSQRCRKRRRRSDV